MKKINIRNIMRILSSFSIWPNTDYRKNINQHGQLDYIETYKPLVVPEFKYDMNPLRKIHHLTAKFEHSVDNSLDHIELSDEYINSLEKEIHALWKVYKSIDLNSQYSSIHLESNTLFKLGQLLAWIQYYKSFPEYKLVMVKEIYSVVKTLEEG